MASVEVSQTIEVDGPEGSQAQVVVDVRSQPIGAALDQLIRVDEDLARGLGALHGAPDGVVAATIAAYRFGTRSLLTAMGLIEVGDGRPGRVRVSERGKQVIEACAVKFPQSDTDVDSALRAASDLLAHSGRTSRLK
jgi:hypothetical protein